MPKSFPGETPELYSLTVQRDRSHTKKAPGVLFLGTERTSQGGRAMIGEQMQAGANAHQ